MLLVPKGWERRRKAEEESPSPPPSVCLSGFDVARAQGRNDGQTPPAKVGEDLGSDTAVVDQRRPLLLF